MLTLYQFLAIHRKIYRLLTEFVLRSIVWIDINAKENTMADKDLQQEHPLGFDLEQSPEESKSSEKPEDRQPIMFGDVEIDSASLWGKPHTWERPAKTKSWTPTGRFLIWNIFYFLA